MLLDNVANADQARLLLPGAGDSFAIITSRSRLLELDQVHPISLNVFSETDARVLFETAVGDERVSRDPAATTEVLRLCGHLPLAIRVAAARLRHRPSWTVSTLAERLSADLSQLDVAFVMSLHQLDPAQRQMFLLLGLMPGIDFDAYAAAALADVPLANARSILEDLVDAHLVQQPTADRHRLHDLLRQHARGCPALPQVPEDRPGQASPRPANACPPRPRRRACRRGPGNFRGTYRSRRGPRPRIGRIVPD